MIRLVHAHGTSPLLDALAEDVARARRAVGPLEPLVIAVPGPAGRAHVEQGLAHRLGIAAHLALRSLRGIIAEVVAASAPGVELVGVEGVAGALLELFHRPGLLEDPELGPVADYLRAPDRDAVDERRVDLARALARLYDGYLHHRPEWAQAWRRAAGPPEGVPGDTWRWQGALFRHLVDPASGPLAPVLPSASRPRARWLLLDALAVEGGLDPARAPDRLFVFDVPIRAPVLARALERIAQRAELHLYLPNPCLEFWEDVPSGLSASALAERLAPRGAERAGDALDAPSDPAPLRLWGRPGREELRLAHTLAGWDADARFALPEDAPSPSALEALQRDVLLRAPERARPAAAALDDSVRVWSAPGVRRECEAIAAEIWRLLTVHPALRLSDVVVALGSADADLYRSQLAAAFAEMGDLPAHEIDVPLAAESRIVDAVRLLLALPRSDFTRRDLAGLLTHPALRARHGIGDTEDWTTWMDRLGIVRGADQRDLEGTYIDKALFHWDQGLGRLALGAFMAGEGAGRPDAVTLSGVPVLPTDFAAHELPSAGRLIALVRSLVADAQALAAAEVPLETWAAWLRELTQAYLAAVGDADERDLYRVLASIDELRRLAPGGPPMRFAAVARLLELKLDALTTHRGQPLAEAVVIAPLGAVASLPFEVCFLPGLAEGAFPAPERPSALDLRRGGRRPGDVSPRARDEYAFLLRLLSTRSALRLSYVGRDPRTGDARAPASTLAELVGILERGYVPPDAGLVSELSLRRLDAPGPSVAARAEADARALAHTLQAHLPVGAPRPELQALESALPPEVYARLARRLRLPRLPALEDAADRRPRVSLAHLRRFLEDPLQGWCRQVLGLGAEDLGEDQLALTDEPFEPSRLLSLSLLRETFLASLAEGEGLPALLERYEAAADRLELGGQLPTGVFGDAARRRHHRLLEGWARGAREALEGRVARLGRLELGRATPSGARGVLAPALELPRARVTGSTEPLFEDGGCLVLLDRPIEGDRQLIRHELKAWLAQLAWAASDRPSAGAWRAFVADGGERLRRGALRPVDPDTARDLLDGLARELLDGRHVALLPLDAQLRLREARAKGAGQRRLQDILDRAEPDDFGPLKGVRLAPPPVDEALAIVERRLGPFLDARLGEGAR